MQQSEIRKKRNKTADEALAALMRLCARAEKSSGDALRLMRTWGVEPREQQRVLERLVEQRFIDNERFAGAFVREKLRRGGGAPTRSGPPSNAKGSAATRSTGRSPTRRTAPP